MGALNECKFVAGTAPRAVAGEQDALRPMLRDQALKLLRGAQAGGHRGVDVKR